MSLLQQNWRGNKGAYQPKFLSLYLKVGIKFQRRPNIQARFGNRMTTAAIVTQGPDRRAFPFTRFDLYTVVQLINRRGLKSLIYLIAVFAKIRVARLGRYQFMAVLGGAEELWGAVVGCRGRSFTTREVARCLALAVWDERERRNYYFWAGDSRRIATLFEWNLAWHLAPSISIPEA
jgi:hypothetical protein